MYVPNDTQQKRYEGGGLGVAGGEKLFTMYFDVSAAQNYFFQIICNGMYIHVCGGRLWLDANIILAGINLYHNSSCPPPRVLVVPPFK